MKNQDLCLILDIQLGMLQKQYININFLKNKFSDQSDLKIGKYQLDLNSRKIIFNNITLNLTERETNLIIFIYQKGNVSIKELQKKVWDYSDDLETHKYREECKICLFNVDNTPNNKGQIKIDELQNEELLRIWHDNPSSKSA